MDNNKIDEGLQGNEKIETAIAALQQEASEEMLAHTLTVIRRRNSFSAFNSITTGTPPAKTAHGT